MNPENTHNVDGVIGFRYQMSLSTVPEQPRYRNVHIDAAVALLILGQLKRRIHPAGSFVAAEKGARVVRSRVEDRLHLNGQIVRHVYAGIGDKSV